MSKNKVCIAALLSLAILATLVIVARTQAPTQTSTQKARAALVAENTKQTMARFAAEEQQSQAQAMIKREADDRLRDACRQAAPRIARHASTVSFPWYGETTITETGLHRFKVSMLMATKNSFGLELRYTVTCTINRSVVTAVTARETA